MFHLPSIQGLLTQGKKKERMMGMMDEINKSQA
jgi:hypothetical protein